LVSPFTAVLPTFSLGFAAVSPCFTPFTPFLRFPPRGAAAGGVRKGFKKKSLLLITANSSRIQAD